MRFTSNTYRSLTESINTVQSEGIRHVLRAADAGKLSAEKAKTFKKKTMRRLAKIKNDGTPETKKRRAAIAGAGQLVSQLQKEEAVSEDIQTPERAAEMKRKIKWLASRERNMSTKYNQNWRATRDTPEKQELGKKLIATRNKLVDAEHTDRREKKRKLTLYGKGGKEVATRSVQSYTDWKPTETKTKKKVQTEGIKHILRAKHSGKLSTEKAQTFKNKVARRLSKIKDDGTPTTALRKGAIKAQGAVVEASSPAWTRAAGKDPEGGLNKAGVASYRRENPGSKLQTAVTTEPSKLKRGSKKWKRRKSFCSRMKGMKAKLTSSETARDPDSRINKSLRKWNC